MVCPLHTLFGQKQKKKNVENMAGVHQAFLRSSTVVSSAGSFQTRAHHWIPQILVGRDWTNPLTYIYIYMCVYIYMCIYIYVCVYI